ncbi:MAG: hypothetical protein QM296_08415 [Bacillota bacterium]|nr:hypothetical protein [Bacillota bacterium]
MARYCFYCNRELKPGEACSCRTASQRAQTTEQSQAAGPEAAAKKTRTWRRTRSAVNFNWRRASVSVFAWLRQLLEFFTQPTQAIRRHAHAGPVTWATALFFAVVLSAMLQVAIVLDSSFGNLLLYHSRKLAVNVTLGTRLRLFLRFLPYPLLYFAIKWLLYFIMLRRQLRPAALASALTPGAVYLAMVMALGQFFVRSGGLQALCLLIAAIILCQIADHLALESLLSLPADRLLRLALITILLLAILFGAVLNILLPNISDLRISSNLA